MSPRRWCGVDILCRSINRDNNVKNEEIGFYYIASFIDGLHFICVNNEGAGIIQSDLTIKTRERKPTKVKSRFLKPDNSDIIELNIQR